MSAPLEKPWVVFVTAENRCNLKCKSCAIWEDMAETDDNGEPRLAEDEMFRLIDKVKASPLDEGEVEVLVEPGQVGGVAEGQVADLDAAGGGAALGAGHGLPLGVCDGTERDGTARIRSAAVQH